MSTAVFLAVLLTATISGIQCSCDECRTGYTSCNEKEYDYNYDRRCVYCVPNSMICDGRFNCNNGHDERKCECNEDQFACASGGCIPKSAWCDHKRDCEDYSDLKNCTCGADDWACPMGGCIPTEKRCDGVNSQCIWSHDEEYCPCRDDQFSCGNGECVSNQTRCDSFLACANGADEEDCQSHVCPDTHWKCDDGSCVRHDKKCNGWADCKDSSDEAYCNCTADEFTCAHGGCIPLSKRCDRIKYDYAVHYDNFEDSTYYTLYFERDKKDDCGDGSDEKHCSNITECDAGQFSCDEMLDEYYHSYYANYYRYIGVCWNNTHLCDGILDCQDGFDEANCNNCSAKEFKCGSGECVQESNRCNGIAGECADNSDEQDCGVCRDVEFMCVDEKCIDLSQRCDGVKHCDGGEDEKNCACHRKRRFSCGGGSIECIPKWRRCDGTKDCDDGRDEIKCECKPKQFSCGPGSVECIPPKWRCDEIEHCDNGSDELGCTCKSSEFACETGLRHCIKKRQHCNGWADCLDGSDEVKCVCEVNQFACASGGCVPKKTVCDYKEDCEDESDEVDCPPIVCANDEFTCWNGKGCVKVYDVCDYEQHCSDNSDELVCQDFQPEGNIQQLYAASQKRSFYTPEVAEKLLKSLAELVQHRIELSQNPVDCDGRRKLTHKISSSGYGSEIKLLVAALVEAFYTGKVLILKSKGWRYSYLGGWEAFHLPLSNCTVLRSRWLFNVAYNQHFNTRSEGSGLTVSIPADIAPLLVTLHPRPFMWWHAQFVRYVTRLQPWVDDTIARRRKQFFEHGLSKPFVGLHIRRGDKSTEARMVPTKDYMTQAELYFHATDKKLNGTHKRQIYLATDDENLYSEIQSQYPNYDIFVYTTQQHKSYGQDNLLEIIADLNFLTEADFIVCTFSSNVCRRVLEYKQGVSYRDMSDTVVSVDGYYFIMTFSELRVATQDRLVKHKSNNTLTFKKGDFIETTYRDFVDFPPGIEYGINVRTGSGGKYHTTDTVYYTQVREWPNYKCQGQLNKYITSLHGRI